MPWFVKKENDRYCVTKGTKEAPGETLKCYDSKAEAVKYLKAIYTNYKRGGGKV